MSDPGPQAAPLPATGASAAPQEGAGVIVGAAAGEVIRLQLANMAARGREAAGQPTA